MLSVEIVPNITLFVTVFSNATLGSLLGCYFFVSNECPDVTVFIAANSFSLPFGGLCP